MIVAINGRDYTTAYIDRIECSEQCIKGTSLTSITDAMAKFGHLGLYTIRQMCPWVSRFTLIDDSELICNGLSGPSISLSYDYLIKYNMTWYQKKFGARLDGLIDVLPDIIDNSIETIHIVVDGKNMTFHTLKGSPMHTYLHSLKILDQPCIDFSLICDLLPELVTYRPEISLHKFVHSITTLQYSVKLLHHGSIAILTHCIYLFSRRTGLFLQKLYNILPTTLLETYRGITYWWRAQYIHT